jgi:hypothetical protein
VIFELATRRDATRRAPRRFTVVDIKRHLK